MQDDRSTRMTPFEWESKAHWTKAQIAMLQRDAEKERQSQMEKAEQAKTDEERGEALAAAYMATGAANALKIALEIIDRTRAEGEREAWERRPELKKIFIVSTRSYLGKDAAEKYTESIKGTFEDYAAAYDFIKQHKEAEEADVYFMQTFDETTKGEPERVFRKEFTYNVKRGRRQRRKQARKEAEECTKGQTQAK